MKATFVRAIVGFAALLVTALLLGRLVPARSAPLLPGAKPLATISGRVTLDNGGPAAGCSVVARSIHYVTPAPAGEAVTDANGRYRIVLDPNLSPDVFRSEASTPADTEYTVSAEGQEPLYLVPPSRTVTLPPSPSVTGVDFRLTVGPQITVHVRDFQSGQPVPGVSVKYLKDTDYSNNYSEAAVTDAQGNAVFRVPSLSVRLSLVPPGGNTPAIRTASGSQFYREVRLTQVQDVTWDVLTEPTLPPMTPTVWRGIVLTADGQPADSAKVSVLRGDAEAKTVTDKQGRFMVSLPPLTEQQYSYGPHSAAFVVEKGGQSAVVIPTPDATQGGMAVRLTQKPLGSYAGTVVGADGSPEAGVRVSGRGWLTATGEGINRNTMTDDAGRFKLSGLPAGRYQVNLGGGAFGSVPLPPSGPGTPYSAASLTLGDGEQHTLGRVTVLPADEVVAGQIVRADGTPVSSRLMAIVHGAHTNQMASLDTEGRFRVYHVVREPLTLDLYRAEANGGFSLGQTSPDLFLKVPVKAGREDVRVTLPLGALPLPAPVPVPAPVPAAPSGPPHVSAVSGVVRIGGLWLSYNPEGSASDPQLIHIHARLETQLAAQVGPGTPWQGSLADMDGMQLVVKNYQGTLKDRAEHTLWTGALDGRPEPAAYTVDCDTAKPGYLTLLDKNGHTLWSGPYLAKVAPVQTLDGNLVVIGSANRIVWEQPAVPGPIRYRVLDHGRDKTPKPPDGMIRFAAAPRRAVFRTLDGKVFYSGPLLTLLLTATDNAKPVDPLMYDAQSLSWVPTIIFPFWTPGYRGGMKYDLYDPSGRIIRTFTMQPQ